MKFVSILALALMVNSASAETQTKSLHILALTEGINTKLFEEFKTQTDVDITFDNSSSPESFLVELDSPSQNYDLIIAPDYMFTPALQSKVQKIDRTKIPNLKNIFAPLDVFLEPKDSYISGIPVSVDIMGIVRSFPRDQKVNRQTIDSWDFLLRPEILRPYVKCGIYYPESSALFRRTATIAIKEAKQARNDSSLSAAVNDLVTRSKIFRKKLSVEEHIDAAANGRLCFSVTTLSQAKEISKQSEIRGSKRAIFFDVPRWSLMTANYVAVLERSKKTDTATQLMNFLLNPDVAKILTSQSGLVSTVLANDLYAAEASRGLAAASDFEKKRFFVSPIGSIGPVNRFDMLTFVRAR